MTPLVYNFNIKPWQHVHHHGQSSGVKNENDWCSNTNDSAHSGCGSLVRSEPRSEITNHDWTDDRTKVQEYGWGNTADVSSQRQQQSLAKSTPSELSCNGWINEPVVEEYNVWGVPEPQQGCRDASAEVHYQGWENTSKDKTASSDVSSWEAMDKTDNASEFRPIVYPAPPVPEEVEDVHYPVIDLSPLHLSNPPVEQKTASVTTQKEKEHEPTLCIICWEASVVSHGWLHAVFEPDQIQERGVPRL
ncbi:hypothetical protein KY290_027070 [Solanum tuberosum]|uniref:Uncharacterized protein n=1 Tax=Solanum tuberosum TaxID=4113 RepID=A0ABQ7UF66_SOLTU|nr:hypothetical protein KY284_026033 [Solanum tuberosum]KAH0747838.1 hypothetical protein KY290_027070 [Solanum tuberosum]